jgi:glycosyltransferase involved in cell wall biosynthesis
VSRRALVLDVAYSLRTIRERELEQAVVARDLDGWFDHVWNVHPLVGADPADQDQAVGPIRTEELAPRHTVVEHVSRFRLLRRLPPLDLAASQLALVVHLLRLIRREGIDVIRAGDPYYLGLLGLLLARCSRIPLVIRINGNYDAIHATTGRLAYPRIFRSRRIEKLVDRFVLRRAALVAAPNEDNLEFALANGARRDASAVFPYGNLLHPVHFEDPAERPDVRGELGVGGRDVVVYVSRLEPVKRPADLLVLAEALRDRGVDAAVVIVGDGSLRDELADRARAAGVADRFILPGSRSQTWIASLLAHAAVIAAPHNGRSLVESALSARPIVAYDSDWHRELVVDGTSGILVPDGDASAMSAAVLELLADPERARALGTAARSSALERMSPRTLAAVERAAYERILT